MFDALIIRQPDNAGESRKYEKRNDDQQRQTCACVLDIVLLHLIGVLRVLEGRLVNLTKITGHEQDSNES